MTAVLQLLQDIAGHLEVRTSIAPERLRDLIKTTDLGRLTDRMDELAEPTTSTGSKKGEPAMDVPNSETPPRSVPTRR